MRKFPHTTTRISHHHHHNGPWWNDVKYYVPLCQRPVIPVTIEMLEKVNALKTDKEIVTKCKDKLQFQLSEYLGSEIPQDSPHIYSGTIVRGAIYTGIMCWFLPIDALEFMVPIFLMSYSMFSFFFVDSASLHKKYMILTKKNEWKMYYAQ